MVVKYTSIFHYKALKNLSKLGFLVWKLTIWQPWHIPQEDNFRPGIRSWDRSCQNFTYRRRFANLPRDSPLWAYVPVLVLKDNDIKNRFVDIEHLTRHSNESRPCFERLWVSLDNERSSEILLSEGTDAINFAAIRDHTETCHCMYVHSDRLKISTKRK
jgi:hypothetical protein